MNVLDAKGEGKPMEGTEASCDFVSYTCKITRLAQFHRKAKELHERGKFQFSKQRLTSLMRYSSNA